MDKGLLHRRVTGGLVIAMFVVVVGLLIIGNKTASRENDDISTKNYAYTGKWYWIDGKDSIEVEIPGHIDGIKAGEPLILETTLPNSIDDGDYFIVYTDHQDVRISVADYIRTIFTAKSYDLSGNNSPSKYVFAPLEITDKGKILRMSLTAYSTQFTGNVLEVYLAEKHDLWMYIFRSSWLDITIALYTMVLGIIILAACALVNKYYSENNGIIYLALNVFVIGIGMVFNLKVRQLIFPVFSILDIAAFFLLIISDFVLNEYVFAMIGGGAWKKLHDILGGLLLFDFAIVLLLHVTKILDVQSSRSINLGICMIVRLALLFVILMQLFGEKKREHLYSGIGTASYIVFSVIGQCLYFKQMATAGNVFVTVGISANAVGLIFTITNVYLKSEEDKKSAIIEAQARTMFLATMSHDIRTPINTVLGMNEMVLRENRDPQITEYSRDIQRAGKMLLNLVNDILDFSKIDSGKLELVIDDYRVGLVISDLINLIDERAKEKHLQVICNVDPDIPAELRGDEMRVKQIVMNLLTNAVKYTERGSVTLNVTGGYASNNKYVIRFDVIDTGQGIKKENIDKLFLNYTRLEEKSNKGIEGTGLGLGITKNLLDIMGGSITVTSEYGVGSTFTVFIPQESISRDKIGDFSVMHSGEIHHKERKLFTAPDAHVLVVDDNRMNLNVIKGLLKETKIQLDLARSGQECLDLCGRLEYDLILMDHMMPEMDGIETLHRLNEAWNSENNGGMVCKKIPVIILTANAISGMREMYLSQGFSDYLSKPVDPDKLEDMVRQYIPADKLVE